MDLPTNGGTSLPRGSPNFEEEPMCMLTTVRVSSQARQSGSQYPEKMLGRPSQGGHSENATAQEPLAAHRRTSAAARSESHSGITVMGMKRPRPTPPHHSSSIQSL